VEVLERAHNFGRVEAGGFRREATGVSQVGKKLTAAHVLEQHVESIVVVVAPLPLTHKYRQLDMHDLTPIKVAVSLKIYHTHLESTFLHTTLLNRAFGANLRELSAKGRY
jgi:hypothetical protein